MRKYFGWGLIGVFGGGVLYLLGDWIVRTLNGYYVGHESTTALAITGIVTAVALVPVSIGIWLVRKENGGLADESRPGAVWVLDRHRGPCGSVSVSQLSTSGSLIPVWHRTHKCRCVLGSAATKPPPFLSGRGRRGGKLLPAQPLGPRLSTTVRRIGRCLIRSGDSNRPSEEWL